MSRAATELDFFGLDKQNAAASSASHLRRNYRGIQKSTISQISPQLLKSVIAGGSSNSVPSALTADRVKPPPSLPIYVPSNSPVTESSKETPPLTIFFNGTVSVFNVPRDKVESIMKAAMEGSSKSSDESENMNVGGGDLSGRDQQLLGTLTGDLPLFRRMSLQRFLEKRKARLNSISPYMCNSNYG